MSDFEKLLDTHLNMVHEKFDVVIGDLKQRSKEHDMDKLNDPQIKSIYDEHFPELKRIAYGTKEYYEYERRNFDQAHQKHAQNRHHFYSHRNNMSDVNLLDVIEALIDITQSAKQYDSDIDLKTTLKNKGILDYNLEELIMNTAKFLD